MNKFLILTCSMLMITGCGSSGDQIEKNDICKDNFISKQHSMEEKGAKKVDPETDKSVEKTNLELKSVNLLVDDRSRNIRLNLVQNITEKENGELVSTFDISCVGGSGFNSKMEPYTLSIPVVRRLQLEKGAVQYATANAVIDIRQRPGKAYLDVTIEKGHDVKPGSLKAIYQDYSNLEQFYFENSKIKQLRNSMSKEISAARNSSKSQLQVKTTQSFQTVVSE